MKNVFLILCILSMISCSKDDNSSIESKPNEIELNIYLLGDTKDTKVKVSSSTDEGNFDFEIKSNLYNRKFKTTKGYSFVANCINPKTLIIIEVVDPISKKILNKESDYSLVKTSSK